MFSRIFLTWICLANLVSAQSVILHLKNGDRLAGTIVAEDTNRVVLTTTWVKELAVPLAAIERRETPAESAAAKPGTNTVAGGRALVPLSVATVPSHAATTNKHWKVEARLGADFLFGAKDQQLYYGRFKLTYQHPYAASPKQFFRNILDYSADYGRTEGILSANRMDASDKTDVDIGKRIYVYNLLGVGFDEIQKIDMRYEVGPGFGYHLITHSNFVMNAELGADYQAQYRSEGTTKRNFFPRLAEDITWRLNQKLMLTEKLEYFPPVDSPDYRARFESNLSYGFWQRLSLNLTVLDLYDSEPAQGVPTNDLQVRSSLGITF